VLPSPHQLSGTARPSRPRGFSFGAQVYRYFAAFLLLVAGSVCRAHCDRRIFCHTQQEQTAPDTNHWKVRDDYWLSDAVLPQQLHERVAQEPEPMSCSVGRAAGVRGVSGRLDEGEEEKSEVMQEAQAGDGRVGGGI